MTPLAEALGEDSLRPVTQMIVSAFEALMLGVGVVVRADATAPPVGRDWPDAGLRPAPANRG